MRRAQDRHSEKQRHRETKREGWRQGRQRQTSKKQMEKKREMGKESEAKTKKRCTGRQQERVSGGKRERQAQQWTDCPPRPEEGDMLGQGFRNMPLTLIF